MIDITIIVTFLVMTLLVGLSHGKKIRNIKEYAIGSRDFSTGAIVATLVATWTSGSSFFLVLTDTYSLGLYDAIPTYGMVLTFFIMAYIFIPRMNSFLGSTSIAESLGDLYGKNVRIVVAIAGSMASIGFIAVQFKVFGGLFSYFLGLSSAESIILSASIVTIYSAFGGIKSVTFTDVLQLITFGLAIPIVGIMIWNQAFQDSVVLSFSNTMDVDKFNISKVLSIDHPDFFSMVALFFYFTIPGIKPDIFQRISMGRDIYQVKKAFIISGFLILAIILATQWIPFLLHTINPDIKPNHLLGYIIDNYTYTGFKGMLIVGIMAMSMSTADSHINSSSVLFANDLCKPLNLGKGSELIISKIFASLLGVSAIILAITTQNLLDVILATNSFYIPIVTIPMMLTILGFRTSTLSIAIGMLFGGSTILIWKILGIKANGIAFSMLINLIFLMGSHYILRQPGGWTEKTASESGKEVKSSSLLSKIYNLYQNNSLSFFDYCKKKSPTDDFSYIGLGIYFIIFTITTMYNTQTCLLRDYCGWVIYLYQIMIVCSMLIISYPIWPVSISATKKLTFAQILWPISVFFMLVLCNSFFVLISNFSSLQFAVFTANLLITAHIFGWRLAPPLIIIGSVFSFVSYQGFNLDKLFGSNLKSPAFIIIYILALTGATLVIFLKPKQEHLEETEAKIDTLETEVTHLHEKVVHYNERISDQEKEIERLGATAQKILNNVNHELRLPVGNVMNFAEMLGEGLGKFSEDQLKTLSDEVYKNSNRLSSMIMNMLDLATLNAKKLELDKKVINLGELVEDRVNNCRKIYLEDKKIDFELKIHSEIFVSVDPNYMRQVVDNLVINAIKFSSEGVISVQLLKNKDKIEFTIKDNGIGIPREELYDIFTPFKMGSNTESKAEGRGVGLALCKAAIEAHGGAIIVESDGVNGARFRFVL